MSSILSRNSGFTIVEVLVIIVVIGILASIGIASYNGYQQRAHDAAVQSDLDTAAGLLEAYRVRSSNTSQTFPDTNSLDDVGIRISMGSYDETAESNFIYCAPSNYATFSLVALSRSGKTFRMTQDGFKDTTLTKDDFSNDQTVCNSFGQGYDIDSGLLGDGLWATWVGGTGSTGGEEGEDD